MITPERFVEINQTKILLPGRLVVLRQQDFDDLCDDVQRLQKAEAVCEALENYRTLSPTAFYQTEEIKDAMAEWRKHKQESSIPAGARGQ